ncbi:MAG: ATP-binding protein [Deferribacterales bacterium]
MKTYKLLLILLSAVILHTASASALDKKNILFISSFNQSMPWPLAIKKGISDTLKAQPNDNINLYEHYFDTLRLGDIYDKDVDFQYFKNRFSNVKIDMVISDSVFANKFMNDVNDELFGSDVPVIYFADRNEHLQTSSNDLILLKDKAKVATQTFNMADRINPKAKRAIVISGKHDEGVVHEFNRALRQAAEQEGLEFVLLDDITFTDLRSYVSRLTNNDLLFYAIMSKDKEGAVRVPNEVVQMIADYSPVPVYTFHSTFLNTGAVGGYSISAYDIGVSAAYIALNYFRTGELRNDINYTKCMIDYNAVKRHGLKRSDFPPYSEFINADIPFWKKNPVETTIVSALLMLLTMLTCTLLFYTKKLKKLIRSSIAGICVMNRYGMVVECSSSFAKMLGYKNDEIYAKTIFDWDVDITDEEFQHMYRKRPVTPVMREHKYIRKDGSLIDVETWTKGITFGRRKYLYMMSKDVTKEKMMEEKLKKQNEYLIQQSKLAAMGEMISAIAHQWRQPLGTAGIGLSIIYDIYKANENAITDEDDKHDMEEAVSNVENAISYLSDTIDDFRNFYTPNNTKEVFVLYDVINSSFKFFEGQLLSRGVEYTVSCPRAIKLEGVSSQLRQVLLSLINNSINAFENHPHQAHMITVRADSDAENVVIQVCDTGGGIDENIINKIFEPYFTTKGPTSGTGLGLYIAKLIVENTFKGAISAHNNNEGAVIEIRI